MVFLLLLISTAVAQTSAVKLDPALDKVLNQMDTAAANFHTASASFVWDQYTKLVDDTDSQKGKIYYRRQNKEIQMAADITEPAAKYLLYANDKVQVYVPKIDQVTEYHPGKSRADVESFLVLGFGGGGHELLKSYEVKLLGSETINGVTTAKLELVSKSPKFRNNIERILLWIDPTQGISLRQQFLAPGGDYRLSRYSDIKVNQKIPEAAFKLKTTDKTQFLSPKG